MVKSILGVDFSGAKNAGESIWLASGELDQGRLKISTTWSPAGKGKRSRPAALECIQGVVADGRYDVVGFDFPFGLPREVVDTEDWASFLSSFDEFVDEPKEDESPVEAFRRSCLEAADQEYLKRATDEERGGQCPYGVRVASQTYYGISEVLKPLIENGVSVMPMMENESRDTAIVEVYPARTLAEHFDESSSGYKGTSEQAIERRRRILESIESAKPPISFDSEKEGNQSREYALCSDDALDAILAAVSASNFLREPAGNSEKEIDPVEGYICV